MASIDIRGNNHPNPDTIVFADLDNSEENVVSLVNGHKTSKSIDLVAVAEYGNQIALLRTSIPNLILALQKAVDLGWVPVDKPKVVRKPAAKKVVAKPKVVKK